MKYKKITEHDVLNILTNVELDIMSPINCINPSSIARILKTSRYQVKKIIGKMVKDETAELVCQYIGRKDEMFPPYWGYRLTENGRNTTLFKEKQEEHLELIKKCFGLD